MAQISIACSNSRGILLDRKEVQVDDLLEAYDCATTIARSLIATASIDDWRRCRLDVCDDLGLEIFVMPFSSILGKPN
jgi:Domain of unknown function (DUF6894)